ncbi:MAG: gliding motility lipoprotein GldH [Chitinophagaceae bacterium]
MNLLKRLLVFLVMSIFLLASCTSIDLYERSVAIPGHAWKSSYKPSFTFTIKDTAASYQLFLVLRHTDEYNYNNIFINLTTKQLGSDSTRTGRYDLRLATDTEGWLGTGMDDIYEHRIPLTPAAGQFRIAGDYTFTVEQIMREDPLGNVFNVGLRIEKK